jgi:starvation-inducible outer membrane lipoprotein
MKLIHLITLTTTTVCAVLSGCTANSLFPSQVTENLSPTFHFEAWRDASPTTAAGQADAGLRVELGGRIVQASRIGKGIVIVAEQLPIVQHPVYGPTEDVKRTGDYEFAFLYPGDLEPQDLKNGNRFVIVGTTTSRRPVVVNGVPKTEPFLVADCIHVWQTGRTEIAEFKEDAGGGYSPLPEKTYCVAQP